MKKLMVPAAVLAALISVVACDKDNNNPPNTTLNKIRAKWDVSTIRTRYGSLDSTYNGVAADYVDFRTDGKVYSNVNGEKDTSAYLLVNDSRLVIDGDTTTIKTLTASQFVLESSELILEDTLKSTVTLSK